MKNSRVRILLIEDDEDDYVLVRGLLSKAASTKYDLEWVQTYGDALKAIERDRHDVYLLDYYLGERTGLEILKELNRMGLTAPVIFLTGRGDYETDVEAMRAGASDYLVKGQINGPLLERSIRYAIAQREAEEQLRQAQKMEAIGTLAGGIAHDFNNILASILGFTEMAIEDVSDRPLVEKNLRNVLKSAMRARELVKQILAFSRKAKYERSPLALSPVIKETVHLLRASIPAMIEIELAVTATQDTILAAPIEVQQILMNLATNASLAMQGKGGVMEISLIDINFEPDTPVLGTDVRPGDYLQLMVKDTGIGMSPEVMKRVFEPFFTTREVGKGTGMGLAVVYGIVRDLEGAITVESEVGKGSTFRVLIPKIKIDKEVEVVRLAAVPRGREKILFVDDEEMLVEWGQTTLERLGYKVTTVTDSNEALKVFSADPSFYDLVITDQAMPGMAGVQLAAELLRVRNSIPIILCTGHSETISSDKAKEIGIREFLMKPLAKQELAQAVRRVLDEKAVTGEKP